MAYTGRPFGRLAYSWGPYSQWRFLDLAAGVAGRSGLAGEIRYAGPVLVEAAIAGRSGLAAAAAYAPILAVQAGLAGQSSAAAQAGRLRPIAAPVMAGRSGAFQRLTYDAILQAGVVGRGGIQGNARLYWERDLGCGADWAPGGACDAIWTEPAVPPSVWSGAAPGDTTWTASAGCDAPWVVQPPPPLSCPEVVNG